MIGTPLIFAKKNILITKITKKIGATIIEILIIKVIIQIRILLNIVLELNF